MIDAVLWYALCITLLAFCAAVLIAVTAIQDDFEMGGQEIDNKFWETAFYSVRGQRRA